jgi:hypothetical protein
MGDETKAKEAELAEMANEKAALEALAVEREAQLAKSLEEAEAKAAALAAITEERGNLEQTANERPAKLTRS